MRLKPTYSRNINIIKRKKEKIESQRKKRQDDSAISIGGTLTSQD